MCGISGGVGTIDDSLLQAVLRMDDAQAHRGPDDKGVWSSATAGSGAILAHRRLAIIDLRPQSAQPMQDPETGNIVVFNGEIYNFRELRVDLEAEGHTFRTTGDTEVLLKAYAQWGTDCLNRMRGMFAFALWDIRRKQLFLARDPMGIKPLYWAKVSGAGGAPLFLFSSEIRALLASDLVPRTFSPDGLATYLWNGFVVGPPTIVDGVHVLPGGHWCIVGVDGSMSGPHAFWTLPKESAYTTLEDVHEALREAVRFRLVSDVPLGVFLSGGVDSSAVAVMAAHVLGDGLRTFTVTFPDTNYDEAQYAQAVALAIGSEHTEVPIGPERFRDLVPCAIEHMDQPTFDYINSYIVSRAVREAGITVALAGVGGDELFGGYRSFSDVPRGAQAARALGLVPEPLLRALAARAAGSTAHEHVPRQTRWGKLGDLLAARGRLLETYQIQYSLFTEELRSSLAPGLLRNTSTQHGLPREKAEQLRELVENVSDLRSVSLLELSCFVGERLLRDIDVASMAVSLEVRVPLLDRLFMNAVAGLDPTVRFKPLGEKQVLRSVMRDKVNPAVFERPKAGFELPLNQWCRTQLHGDIEEMFNDATLCQAAGLDRPTLLKVWRTFQHAPESIYWTRIWALYVLLHWTHRHRMTL